MQPTSHYLTLNTPDGKQIRGTVVYVWAFMDGSIEVHITTSDWLDPYRYEAIYAAPAQSVRGFYTTHSYKIGAHGGYLFKGTFEPTKE